MEIKELKKAWWDERKNIKGFSIGSSQNIFNSTQYAFFNDRESRAALLSGGYRSGKTDILLRKAVFLSLIFPGNEGLLGRKTGTEVEVVTLPQLAEICPPEQGKVKIWEYHPKQQIVDFFNKSKVYVRGLDIYHNSEGYDRGKALSFIRGLNLGWFAIDQAEDVEKPIFEHLLSRLSRNVPFHQAMLTSNPTNFWAYDDFKRNPQKGYKLYEVSMLENEQNLPQDYLEKEKEKELTMPRYYKQYVLGKWDEFMTGENVVLETTNLAKLSFQVKEPLREYKGFSIYKEPNDRHWYQVGVDGSEGQHDRASVSIVDIYTGEMVASYAKRVLYDIVAKKVYDISFFYKIKMVIPESNNMAMIMELSNYALPLWKDKTYGKEMVDEKAIYGFRMTREKKRMLVDNFESLVAQGKAILYDTETVAEWHTFIFTGRDKEGMAALSGKYDDRVISSLLAFWEVNPLIERKEISMQEKIRTLNQSLFEKLLSREEEPAKQKRIIYA